jgi:hypothetical protein
MPDRVACTTLALLVAACGTPTPASSPGPVAAGASAAPAPSSRAAVPREWRSFTSRETGFEVTLPGPVAVTSCANGTGCRSFAVRFGAGAGFFVRSWAFEDAALDVERTFDALRDGWMAAAKETLVSERPVTLAGLPCRAFEATAAGYRVQGRIALDVPHSRVYELSVETATGDPAERDAATFLESFRVLEPMPEDASWREVSSREAGFAAKVPGPVTMSPCDARDCRQFEVRPREGVVFAVMSWTAPDRYAPLAPDRVLDAARDVWLTHARATLVSEQAMTVGGQPARAFRARQGGFDFTGRIVYDVPHRRLFDLRVAWPSGAAMGDDATTFMESFRLVE